MKSETQKKITSTGQLRSFLADMIVGVKNGHNASRAFR